MVRNPVMFVVLVGSVLTTLVSWSATSSTGSAAPGFTLQIALWLWFTVLFANFAEAMAEGRGKAQADTLREVAHADAWPSGCSTRTAQIDRDALRWSSATSLRGRPRRSACRAT